MPNTQDINRTARQQIEENWMDQYQSAQALWIHDGNPKRPHARLTAGDHSSGFFNSKLIIAQEMSLREAARDLLVLFSMSGNDLASIDGVVGPQTGATLLAEYISQQIRTITQKDCFHASPAKHKEGNMKSMIFNEEELALLHGKVVLLCEDVSTTGESVGLTADAITAAGGIIYPCILVLVNRSGLSEINEREIISLIDRYMPKWAPNEECPLCKAGSEALRPKEGNNWALLNAIY